MTEKASKSNKLSDALERKIGAPGTVEVDVGGRRAKVVVKDADRIGVVIDRLRVDGAPGSIEERVKELAENLRPNGERLVPIEVDPKLGGGTLRTSPDDLRGHYHQVDVDTAGAELTRHRVAPDGSRHPEGVGVTREQLKTIVDTMAGKKTPPKE